MQNLTGPPHPDPDPDLDEGPASALLCVDLDGTLISSDLLWEGLFLLLRQQPRAALSVPLWAFRGRASLKTRIADLVSLDAQTLPYIPEVLAYLKAERDRGRKLILVTASDGRWANTVADHLALFDRVLATNGSTNLKGAKKLEAIRKEFGAVEFDYIGDSWADLPVWHSSRRAVLVHPNPKLVESVRRTGKPFHRIEGKRSSKWSLLRLLRPHQWAKNLLVFVPVVASHRLTDFGTLLGSALAFIAFCAMASAIYVLNDLLDLGADRRHSSKHRRPLASGLVSIPKAIVTAGALVLFSLLIGLILPLFFIGHLMLYVVVTTLYSIYLKQKMMVDVLCLAGLYTLRISAGGAATAILISPWLQAFSIFFFLSLAFLKRYTEIREKSDFPTFERIAGRGYMPVDLSLIQVLGPTSGYLAILVFSLYISSADVMKLYPHPSLLWLICPVLLYWISRVWFLGERNQLNDDPVVFAIKDRISYLAAAVLLVVLALASYHGSYSAWRPVQKPSGSAVF
jgi:4-hydroxybenzoate polyprenyltransferase/phosphoserine phosphatase